MVSRTQALEDRLRRVNKNLRVNCSNPGDGKRCHVDSESESGGVFHVSHNLKIGELEEWVNGYLACKYKEDERAVR